MYCSLKLGFPGKTQCVRFKVIAAVLLKIQVFLGMTLSLDEHFVMLPQLLGCASVQEHPCQAPTAFLPSAYFTSIVLF